MTDPIERVHRNATANANRTLQALGAVLGKRKRPPRQAPPVESPKR